MGCFLGCFGLSSKRKRRKPASRDQKKLGSYEPLDSVSTNLDIAGAEPITSKSELSKKPKESLNYKVRKKVSFNLNVQTYEPIPKEDSEIDYWESDWEENKEQTNKDAAKGRQASSLSEGGDSIALKIASYPSNYRYRNCIDSYDEEDEKAYEESDLDDDDDDDDDEYFDADDDDGGGGDIAEFRAGQKEFCGQFSSLSVSPQNKDSLTNMGEERNENRKPVGDANEGGLRSLLYAHSVLKPVENLSQWKAVKARGMQQAKQQRKENVAFEQQSQKPSSTILNLSQSPPLTQEMAVDASLSNWIVSPDSCQRKPASIIKSSIIDVETASSKKTLFDTTYSWRNREDMPVLDFTSLEV